MSDGETTAQTNVGKETSDNNNNNNSSDNNNNNNSTTNKNFNHNRNKVILSNPISYDGETKAVGAVLGLRYEKFYKKLPFSQFVEKVHYYVISNYKDGGDLKAVFKKLQDPMREFEAKHMPSAIEDPNDIQKEIQKERVKQYVAREMLLKSNMVKVYGLVWGQCSAALQSYVKGLDSYEEKSDVFDVLWLLGELKKATSGIDVKVNPRLTMHEAVATLYKMKQGPDESNDYYLDRFGAAVLTVEMAKGGHIFLSPELVEGSGTALTNEEILCEKEKSKAILLLKNADDKRFGSLAKSLKEGSYLSRDEYPTTVASMYELMTKHSGILDGQQRKKSDRFFQGRDKSSANAIFVQQKGSSTSEGGLVPGVNGSTYENVQCYLCHRWGHYKSQCPKAASTGVNLLQLGFTFAQSTGKRNLVDRNWVLLDTCSTDNVCCNPKLVDNVRTCKSDECLEIFSNGGSLKYDKIANFKLLPIKVHLNEKSLANVLSFKHVASIPGVRITADTEIEKSLVVHLPNEKKMIFKECDEGLYYFDTANFINKNGVKDYFYSKPNFHSKVSLLTTVSSNKAKYNTKEIKAANDARKLQQCMGWPSDQSFKNYIENNLILNSKVTGNDVNRATEIYGTAEPLLRGKMVSPSQRRNKTAQIPLPHNLSTEQSRLRLYIDLIYVNGNVFLHTKAKDVNDDLNFVTIDYLKSRTKSSLTKALSKIVIMYLTRGFILTDIYADNEFNVAEYENIFLPARCHIVASNEHVSTIERSGRTIKERCRSTCHGLPYRQYPRLMTRSLLMHVVQWLNAFPSGRSRYAVGPSTIVMGTPQPDFNKPRVPFGSYAMVYVGRRNDMTSRSVPAIALHESNVFGGFYFM